MSNQLELIEQIKALSKSRSRIIIAIAGPPASGKSTFVTELSEKLDNSVVVPMDGFHIDNAILEQRGLISRKGSPDTFDFNGYIALLTRIKTATDTVYAASFDRTNDLSRGAAIEVAPDTKIILTEGNYLLLKQSPWNLLHPLFDLTVFLDVPRDTLQQRLVQRWLDHGLQHTVALDKVISNDLPNAELVIDHSQVAGYTLTN